MTRDSAPDLLVLHAVRVLGFAGTGAVARRFRLDEAVTEDLLLDAEARGWVAHAAFAGVGGWSLSDRGRAEGERLLAAELADVGGRDEVADVHRAFFPLNARLQRACTDWQLRPSPGDRLAANDHADAAWDTRVLDELQALELALAPLADRLGAVLTRLQGYDVRFAAARRRARAGDGAWVDGTHVDSCHRVWFELHEDLVATLGLTR
ncbi:transcriptional regulator [Cellulomonas shaoxiangyii]|uniref:Transcriptional regulator n=1 Tax=Cellulomonas shaoxiangyii TaxID=2566013 RepID=A0A4P7SKI5_9CELL|nr:transcriptional regulator [Cellulomonas shaoxiangyii]QCB94809.1 transcriptional regulator [Cellulomonas shaoxiangyii]TGY86539.1 transcriptional regulator [Cellulomonas shaoxiangyii]